MTNHADENCGAYRAYGLTIASQLALPELLPIPADRSPDVPAATDVTISRVAISDNGLPGGEQISPFAWVHDDSFWLHVPGVARFIVTDGARILVDPERDSDEASVRVFLLGSVLGALLFQRGLLLLHGNAVEVNGRCMVCLGPSGAGKSTLAAGLLKRGYRLLADDVVPIDADCNAIPGFPRLKLWQDTASKLDIDTGGLDRIRPDMNKFNLMIADRFCDTPLPVRWVYILASDPRGSFQVEPITGMKRFRPLRANTYRRRFMEGMALRPEHLARCGALASNIHLARVTRPRGGFEIDTLIDTLLADIEKAG